MTIDVAYAAEFLRENDNYLILMHASPDGDTLGCGWALCWFPGIPLWGALVLLLILEYCLATMWYALRLKEQRDTAALNQGLRRFQEGA